MVANLKVIYFYDLQLIVRGNKITNKQCRAQKSSRESSRNPPQTFLRFLLWNDARCLLWLRLRFVPFTWEKKRLCSVSRPRFEKLAWGIRDESNAFCHAELFVVSARVFLIPMSQGHSFLTAVCKKKRERELDSVCFIKMNPYKHESSWYLSGCVFKIQGVLSLELLCSIEGSEFKSRSVLKRNWILPQEKRFWSCDVLKQIRSLSPFWKTNFMSLHVPPLPLLSFSHTDMENKQNSLDLKKKKNWNL